MNTFFLRAAVGCVALVAAAGTSFAADLARRAPVATPMEAPAPALYNWSGFYAGANVGGDWVRDDLGAGYGKANAGGVFGGVQAGYNYQTGPWVLGVETDVGYGSTKKTKYGEEVKKTWAGTARARAGYAFNNVLLYGTGGLAWADFKSSDAVSSDSKTKAGWTVGGGLEYAVTHNISVKGEYLYADYGKSTINDIKHDFTENLVRVGVNYKF